MRYLTTQYVTAVNETSPLTDVRGIKEESVIHRVAEQSFASFQLKTRLKLPEA